MRFRGFGKSDVGRERGNNEDTYFIDDELGLYVVCDGMGGHKGGEVASRIAAEVVAREIRDRRDELFKDADTGKLSTAVSEAIGAANKEIFDHAASHPELEGMGCAMTLLLTHDHSGFIGHVGDTRLYAAKKGKVSQISRDHTMAEELVRSGTVPAEDQDRIPYGHVLTRAVGSREAVEVEVTVVGLTPGDRYLLCSDGLSGYLEEEGMLDSELAAKDLSTIPAALVEWANERGGKDNITAVVVEVEDD